MSYIGEARGFRRTAEELRRRLQEGSARGEFTLEERLKIQRDIEWYDREADCCWHSAWQEARQDEDDERRGRYTDIYDYEEEDTNG